MMLNFYASKYMLKYFRNICDVVIRCHISISISPIIKIYNIDGKTASTQIFTEMQSFIITHCICSRNL